MSITAADVVVSPLSEPAASLPPVEPPHPRAEGGRRDFGARAVLLGTAAAVLVVLVGAWYAVSIMLSTAGAGFVLPMPHEMFALGSVDLRSAELFAAALAACLAGVGVFALVGRLSTAVAGRRAGRTP